jgi:hypothetical protein
MAKLRRLYPRTKVNFDLTYSFNNKKSKCTILDISETGMLLKIPQILDVDDEIILNFDYKINNINSLKARIVHINNNYVGICILDEHDEIIYLRDFINSIKHVNKLSFKNTY